MSSARRLLVSLLLLAGAAAALSPAGSAQKDGTVVLPKVPAPKSGTKGGGKGGSLGTEGTKIEASENDTATAIRGAPPGGPNGGGAGSDPWWQQHGGAIRFGDPRKPAVLLVHGLHQSAENFLHPSKTGFNYDWRRPPADRDLGSSSTAGVGVESVGISPMLDVDGQNWFDFLASRGMTVATWTMPTTDLQAGLSSANEALLRFQQDTRQLDPASPPPIALVGHSLGGLMIRAMLRQQGNLGGQVRWVVTLFSPHQGSEMANAPQLLEDEAARVFSQAPLPPALKAPLEDLARRAARSLIEAFAPPLDPASRQLAPGSAALTALASGETAQPGVAYYTFGGTNPNYLRVYAWTFDGESALPQLDGATIYFRWHVQANEIGPVSPLLAKVRHFCPEVTPGLGDGLVADARARLPWSVHQSLPLNHAEALWDRGLEERVAAILLGPSTKPGAGPFAGAGASAQEALAKGRDVLDAAKLLLEEAKTAFELTHDDALKGRLGRLVIAFPSAEAFQGTRWEVRASETPDAKTNDGYGDRNVELLPGKYDVQVCGRKIADVEIQPKAKTRLRLGGIHVQLDASTRFEIYDESGKEKLTDGYGDKFVGLPIGRYQVRIAGKSAPVEIEDGKVAEF
jgi:hypothetical protein